MNSTLFVSRNSIERSGAWMSAWWLGVLGLGLVACSKADSPGSDTQAELPENKPLVEGVDVDVEIKSDALQVLQSSVAETETWKSKQLLEAYPTKFDEGGLPFDPLQASGYDVIAGSELALSAADEAAYAEHGFVVSSQQRFATFSYGLHSVYAADVPVFVSADAVLDTIHRSFDDILKGLEREVLIPTLEDFLARSRSKLKSNQSDPASLQQVDLFLAVGQSLLRNELVSPALADSFDTSKLRELFEAARDAEGIVMLELFGFSRYLDFSQFEPRGHYADSEELRRYFKAMMWFGRIDLRLLETQPNGERVLRRDQVAMALLLSELVTGDLRAQWQLVDRIVTSFVGEHDYMTLEQTEQLQADLELEDLDDLDDVSDEVLAEAIVDGNYGEQRIASHVMKKKNPFAKEQPLSASFALFGQRYVVDSHVFSQVVYDRVPDRVVPSPLDAAFGALGNNQALTLLGDELEHTKYPANLGAMRRLVDAHPEAYWDGSLYTLWVGALRELSAGAAPAGTQASIDGEETEPTLPAVAMTQLWGRRLLNTQLASWAQLRHDTLLYAKQSYTGFDDCEYPDAYVDPYPDFWRQLLRYSDTGARLIKDLGLEDSAVVAAAADYFERVSEIVAILARMSEHQLTGMPHSEQDLEFINQAVLVKSAASGPPTIEGWYHRLLFDRSAFSEVDLTIADVHTDPGGALPVARDPSVLHVGTSYPRLMVVAVEGCEGPRAYAGPVSAYKEYLTDGLERLTDEEWTDKIGGRRQTEGVPDVGWMRPLRGQE